MSEGKIFIRFLAGVAIVLLAFSFAACNFANQTNSNAETPLKKNEITVSAAASLQDAFREIGAEFEKQNGVRVNFNFASSGVLQKQIEQGAPVDVFASAGQQQIDALAGQNLIVLETRRDFVKNELVLILPTNFLTKTNTFEQFVKSGGFRIAIGNPKTVPAGQYAEQTLKKIGVWEELQNRLILAEDVRQVLDYVSRGEVDGGIVYASDVKTAENKVQENSRPPENSHEPILYPIAAVKNSKNQENAKKFIDLVLSETGRQILGKYGLQTTR